jgi:hypothetical protein
MLDIVSMLFTLIRTYIPSEIRWSYLMDLYDMFAWNICISTLLYCVFFALWCDHAPACCSPPCACEPFSLPQIKLLSEACAYRAGVLIQQECSYSKCSNHVALATCAALAHLGASGRSLTVLCSAMPATAFSLADMKPGTSCSQAQRSSVARAFFQSRTILYFVHAALQGFGIMCHEAMVLIYDLVAALLSRAARKCSICADADCAAMGPVCTVQGQVCGRPLHIGVRVPTGGCLDVRPARAKLGFAVPWEALCVRARAWIWNSYTNSLTSAPCMKLLTCMMNTKQLTVLAARR